MDLKKGSKTILDLALTSVADAIKKDGATKEVKYPDTTYSLPLIFGVTGKKISKLSELKEFLESLSLTDDPKDNGLTLLFAVEAIEALSYIDKNPYEGTDGIGFIPDNILRELGISLVDGSIRGISVILGKAKTTEDAVNLVRDLQNRSIITLLVGDIISQLKEGGVTLGLETKLIPLGTSVTSSIHAVNFAVRAGLSFGGLKPGDAGGMIGYLTKMAVFVIHLGTPDEVTASAAFGLTKAGIPVILDQDIDVGNDLITNQTDYSKLAQTCLDIKGIKVKILKVDIPVGFGQAFEGERIRKPDVYVEAGRGQTPTFELVTMKDIDVLEDKKITLVGKDLNDMKEGDTTPLGIFVEVAGSKMQKDFESVIERKLHDYVNYAEGIMHIAQRDLVWIRISKGAVKKGFSLKDLGVLIHAKVHSDFEKIVDRVQITIYTDEKALNAKLTDAREVYKARDGRISKMTDEQVDEFYTCLLCQTFAPNHVCIVTPERLGLCGSVSWLDARAAFEINPAGGTSPIKKGKALDEVKGHYKAMDEAVEKDSHGMITTLNLYSIMENPMTSCGCFECIVAIIPECNGFMIVNREFAGLTPSGMNFSTLAGSVGGGNQTPGFMGVSKLYISSGKFISAEGGLNRIVWMPSTLKEEMRAKLEERAEKAGIKDLIDRIADEKTATTPEEVLEFLTKKKHPALDMEPLM